MKRDMDLIRKIMLAAESSAQGYVGGEIKIDGYPDEQVKFHCYLIGEAGLAKTSDVTAMRDKSPQAWINVLTWAGYEFLDESRSDTVWSETKKRVGKGVGTVSMAVLRQLLVETVKQQLGMTP
jgi:hypothetical protein